MFVEFIRIKVYFFLNRYENLKRRKFGKRLGRKYFFFLLKEYVFIIIIDIK